MTSAPSHALTIARPTIQTLTVLNLLYAASISCLLAYSFLMPQWPRELFGDTMLGRYPNVGVGMRVIIVLGILGAGVMHALLRKLYAIVDTVRAGDPFSFENARRLELVGWGVMALECLRMAAVAVLAATIVNRGFAEYSFAPWLAALLIFVLAGVFAQGARMRADLEGTV